MSAIVKLDDIVAALEMSSDDYPSFLDCETGRVEAVSRDLLHDAEASPADEEAEGGDEDDEEDEGEDDEFETAKRIVFNFPGRFKKLPTNREVNDWRIMREFSESIESNRTRVELLKAINGPGAFRMFRASVKRLGIEKAWHEFRDQALRQIAIDWCEENQVNWK
jgi:hypothetical protein